MPRAMPTRPRPRARARQVVLRVLALVVVAVSSTGCTAAQWWRGGWPAPITTQGKHVLGFYQGAMVAALVVGALVSGLIVWAAIRFRQRGQELPRQVRYNLPIEVLYTGVPVVIISVLFYFTVINENIENKLTPNPDITIGVVGFQWSWQFNYQGEDLSVTGRPGQPPQLVLPVGKRIEFIETSPDVIHSFWVVPFLFKRDVFPGNLVNKFQVTITKTGTFQGRCAEYCGADHDRMVFSLKAVTWPQYQAFLQTAKAAASSGQSDVYSLTPVSSGSKP